MKKRGYYTTFLIYFGLVCLLGGSSFPDHPLLLFLRPLSCLFLAVFLLWPRPVDAGMLKIPVLMLSAWAIMIAAQLVPLPPAIWLQLPGRALFAQVASVQGLAQPWRSISVDPDLTLSSLMALLIPAVAMTGYVKLTDGERRRLLVPAIAFALVSALVGIVQIVSGPESPAYFFPRMTRFLPVGLFGNQNHQAALLALCLPMLGVWSQNDAPRAVPRGVATGLAVAMALLLSALVLVTRSRSGTILLIYATLCTAAILYRPVLETAGNDRVLRTAGGGMAFTSGRFTRGRRLAFLTGGVAIPIAAIMLAWETGRASSIQRLFDQDSELRFRAWPTVVRMAARYFPVGSGFGAFDTSYRIDEPDALLSPQYFNRAHNDLLEVALAGGLPAVVLVGAFLAWFLTRFFRTVVQDKSQAVWGDRQKVAAVIIFGLLALSIVDYPLRTPSLALFFTLMVCWQAENARMAR